MAGAQITCENDPNFGIILSFMEQFGAFLDIGTLHIAQLKSMLESSEAVPQALIDLHIKLMRKINKKVPAARWELALAKFAHSYSHQDAWEIERFGYKTANLAVKLRVLKELLEGQFDLNTKFKTQINTTAAVDLRLDPLGRDRQGNCYWYFMDESANLQIYQSDPEMETWTLVASNRDQFVNMIEMLKDNRPIEPLLPVNAGEEEEDSGGSMSESEAMKLDNSIPAPTDVPPSLIISRRTYKTPDQLDATATVDEDEKESLKPEETATSTTSADAPVPTVEEVTPNQPEASDERKEEIVPLPQTASELKTESVEKEKDTVEEENDEPMAEEGMKCEPESGTAAVEEKMEVDEEVPSVVEQKVEHTDKEKDKDAAKVEQNESEKNADEKEQVTPDSKQSDTGVPKAEETAANVLTNTEESRSESDEQAKEAEEVAESGTHVPEETGKTVESEDGSVSESIEDPPVVVKGEGSGAECNSAIEPIFSEAIEEPVMFFFGLGAGAENDMGNTKKIEAAAVPESNAAANAKKGPEGERDCSTIESPKPGNGETKSIDEEVDLSRKVSSTKEKEDMAEQQEHSQTSDRDGNGAEGEKTAAADTMSSKKSPAEKATRAKRNDKSGAAANESAVAQGEKPSEKRRGSRKSNTPKKAFDASVTAATLQLMEGDEEETSKDGTIKEENVAEQEGGNSAKNGDHTVVSSPSDERLKKELKKESVELESKEAEHKEVCMAELHDKKGTKGIPKDLVKTEPLKEEDEGKKEVEEPDEVASNDAPKVKLSKDEDIEASEKSTDVKDEEPEATQPPEDDSTPKRKRRHRNGLVDGLDISMVLDPGSDGGTVRQSRRIAMQKIKEETNRREIEDQMLKKMKADAVKKKKDLGMKISDDDYRADRTSPDHSSDSSSDDGVGADGRRRKKKKKKKKGSLHQQAQQLQQLSKKQSTWNSASPSESSSETEAEDYFAEPYHSEEDVRRNHVLKSDHEFSPESDLETEAPAQPLKRARTARKARRTRDEAEAAEEEEEDEDDGAEDHACQECKKTDQPEWILLCDSCDKGYHCACLKPVLFTIPEGDWFCPVCLHRQLIERLQSKLELYDALRVKLEAEAKRRQEEEQFAREAELAEQALANEREEQLRAQRRARQQQRLLDRADAEGRRTRSGSEEESSRDRRRRRQRHRGRRAPKKRSRSRSGDSSSNGMGSSGSSDGSGSGSDSKSSTDSDDIPIYKLRRRASAKVSYKFNEYDSLIDSAIRREMRGIEMVEEEEYDEDDDEGHGFSKGKDISTIIEATTREEQARKKALQKENESDGEDRRLNGNEDQQDEKNDPVPREEGKSGDEQGEDAVVRLERKTPTVATNRSAVSTAEKKRKKKKKKLCKIEFSSDEEEDDDSDEDFRGEASGSDDDEEEDDDEDEDDDNSMSGDSESSLDMGRGRKNRFRKPSNRAAVKKRRRIVENSDDSDEVVEEIRRAKAKKSRKKSRVLDDSDEELDLDDDDDEDSEDYDSEDLCSDTETESSRSSKSSSSTSSSSAPSTEGDWRRKKKSKSGKSKPKVASTAGGGKHLERPKKTEARPKAAIESSDDSDDSDQDEDGKGGKTMPGRKKSSKKTSSRSSPDAGRGGEKKTDRKTRGKKIHYIVDEDFESSDDGIRPGVQRPDTPPEEREQFIRRQEEIKRMLAENNAAKAKELATSKIDQLVGGRAKDPSKDSLSNVPMQVIESARILDIDFLKSTSGNTARISTVDSVVDFDDELPEDFDPDDEMDDEALAKIMEEEDFAHHQLKPTTGGATASPGELLPPVPSVAKSSRKSIDPEEFLMQQQQRAAGRPMDPASAARKDQAPPTLPLPVNLASSSAMPHPHPHPSVQSSPIKALLKATGIPTSTIMPPIGSAPGGSTILANALQTLPPPPLLKDAHPSGRPEVLMRGGPQHSLPPGGSHSHHKPELSHLMVGLGGSVPLSLTKGVPLPPHHSGHRLPPGSLAMPPNMLGHVPHPSHGANLGMHAKPIPSPGGVITNAGIAAAVISAASMGASGPPSMAQNPPPASPTAAGPAPRMPVGATPPSPVTSSERRPGRRKKITPLREDLKRKGAPGGSNATDQPSVPTAAHQEQHQRPPPQHPSLHHGHMARLPPPPPSSTMPPSSTAGPPIGLRPPVPPVTTSHNSIIQNATAIATAAAAAAAAAAAQELAIKVHSRPTVGGGGSTGAGMHVNEPPLSVPSSVAHLSYFRSENPLFAHRLGPLPSSILSSGSSSLQRIAAISGAAPSTVFGDPAAYNGGWKPSPPAPAGTKPKTSGGPPPPPGMMVGPPTVGSLEHYHDYNPGNHHYNPYYNMLDRAGHLRPPPTIGELHRTSNLSPTTFTTLQPLEFSHVPKPASENHHHQLQHHHHHHSATPSPAASATGGDDGPSRDRSHGAGSVGPPPPAHASSASTTSVPENRPSSVTAAPEPSPPSPTSDSAASGADTVAPSLAPPSASASTPAASSSSTSTSVFGELVSYFSSQQDDLDS
uniref:PHD-type domain-containing protein n=1 Tax=Anopheles christyi TaxID=43041 RepID=A0A182JSP0_9DIPT